MAVLHSVPITDCASKIHLNAQQQSIAFMLDNLGAMIAHFDPAVGDPIAGRGNDIITARAALPESKFTFKRQLADIIGEADYEIVAPYTFHTHLKDGTGSLGEYRGAALGDGEIDLQHAIKCLKDNGYDGVWCAEYEGSEGADTGFLGYKKCCDWMKANL